MSKGYMKCHVRMCQYQLSLLTTGRTEAQVNKGGMSKGYMKCHVLISTFFVNNMTDGRIDQSTGHKSSVLSILWYITILYSLYLVTRQNTQKTNPKKMQRTKTASLYEVMKHGEFYIICAVSSTTKHESIGQVKTRIRNYACMY